MSESWVDCHDLGQISEISEILANYWVLEPWFKPYNQGLFF